MSEPLVAEVVRGRIVESVHLADFAVVDADGRVVASGGDPLTHAAFRSSAKPIQAGVCLEAGWKPEATEHLALACASHSGEPEHVAVAEAVLRAAGLDAGALQCPPALPDPSLPDVVAAAGVPTTILHNCSGKHAAFLATCVARDWPLASYREPGHPLQNAIAERVESLAGAMLETATDGCGAVTFAAPLPALARAFGAVPREAPFDDAARAMRAHPFLVAGSGRLDTAAMQGLEGFVVKGGAEGLVCATDGAVSIAIKCRDGSSRAAGPFLLAVLGRLGLLPDPLPEPLAAHARPVVLGGGRPVGEVRIRD